LKAVPAPLRTHSPSELPIEARCEDFGAIVARHAAWLRGRNDSSHRLGTHLKAILNSSLRGRKMEARLRLCFSQILRAEIKVSSRLPRLARLPVSSL